MNRVKSGYRSRILTGISILVLCFFSHSLYAKNHIITQTINLADNEIQMSPVLDFNSSQAIKEAIDNGVRINLIAKSQLYIAKNWWFDSVLENKKIVIEIYYFKLGRLYVAKNLNSNEQISVNEYEEIWKKFEQIISFNFQMPSSKNSLIRSRVMLDTSALPTTMQLPVLFNNEWDINTEWYSQQVFLENPESE